MTNGLSTNPLALSAAVLVILCGGFLAFHAIDTLATPRAFAAKMEAARASIDYAAQKNIRPDAGAYPANAVCSKTLVVGAADLEAALTTRVVQSGMTVRQVSVAADGAAAAAGLTTLRVIVEAEGGLDSATRLTAALDETRPVVFIDRYELRRQPGGGVLKMAGRAFCWTGAGK